VHDITVDLPEASSVCAEQIKKATRSSVGTSGKTSCWDDALFFMNNGLLVAVVNSQLQGKKNIHVYDNDHVMFTNAALLAL
jgi:hypothetical protein